MTRTNLAYFDGSYGYLTIVSDDESYEIVTTRFNPDRYIRIDDGGDGYYRQLCAGGTRHGATLVWGGTGGNETAAYFARDCNARLFKTRAGYNHARDKVTS